jgi:hypothetical protein
MEKNEKKRKMQQLFKLHEIGLQSLRHAIVLQDESAIKKNIQFHYEYLREIYQMCNNS